MISVKRCRNLRSSLTRAWLPGGERTASSENKIQLPTREPGIFELRLMRELVRSGKPVPIGGCRETPASSRNKPTGLLAIRNRHQIDVAQPKTAEIPGGAANFFV